MVEPEATPDEPVPMTWGDAPPPETSPFSPMGQVAYFGSALRNGMASGGRRRRTVQLVAWALIGLVALGLLASAFGSI